MATSSITITSNVRDVVADMLDGARDLERAAVRALNKMADQVKVQSAREIRNAGYTLKVSDIKSALQVKKAGIGNLTSAVVARGRPIPLIKYGARATSKGVSVSVLNGRKVIVGAFIATMPSGHQGVYIRQGDTRHKKVMKGGKASWHALPIKELFGPSVPDGLANKAVQDVLQQFIEQKFPDILEHESQWLRKKLGR